MFKQELQKQMNYLQQEELMLKKQLLYLLMVSQHILIIHILIIIRRENKLQELIEQVVGLIIIPYKFAMLIIRVAAVPTIDGLNHQRLQKQN